MSSRAICSPRWTAQRFAHIRSFDLHSFIRTCANRLFPRITDYDDSHKALRAHMRSFLASNVWLEHKDSFDALIKQDKGLPREFFEKIGAAGLFRVIVGPPWQAPDLPGIPSLPLGIKPENWNMFHEMIVLDELRNSPTIVPYLFGGQACGLSAAGCCGLISSFASLCSNWGLSAYPLILLNPCFLFQTPFLRSKSTAPTG